MRVRSVGYVMAAAVCVAASSAMGATLTALSTGNPTFSGIVANAISPDGSVVVGTALKSGNSVKTPFLYNVASGTMYDLGPPVDPAPNPNVGVASSAVGVGITSTGTVWVVVNFQNFLGSAQAYLWSGDSAGVGSYTADDIRASTGDNSTATGLAVQIDDEVMVCGNWLSGTSQKGFRYRRNGPSFLDLDKPPTSNYANNVRTISAFGDIGGFSSNSNVGGGNHRQAWTWTSSTYTWLNTIAGTISSQTEATANGPQAMSLDGLHVVGRSFIQVNLGNPWRAYMQIGGVNANGWANVLDLGVIPGRPVDHTYSEATAVNGYGTVVAGYSMVWPGNTDRRIFVWDAGNGMRDLASLAGDPAGWVLSSAVGLSQDGATAVGNGTNGGVGDAWLIKQIYNPPLPAPGPDIVTPTPNPQSWTAGRPYTKTLALGAGRLPVPSWSVLQGPAGLQVAAAGQGATVSNWTPDATNIGTPVTIQIQASSASGSDSETWVVNVVAPSTPKVDPVLREGATAQVVVSGLHTFATEVALYKNGSLFTTVAVSEQTSVTIPVTALVAGDYYTATQSTGSGAGKATSSESIRRYVFPTTPLNVCDNFEAAVLRGDWRTYYGGLTLSTEQNHTTPPVLGQSAKQTTTGVNLGGALDMDVAPTNPTDPVDQYRHPVLYEFWLYHTAETGVAARHVGRIVQYNGGAEGYGVDQYLFEVGVLDSVTSPGETGADKTVPDDVVPFDPNGYQGRMVVKNTGGTVQRNFGFNLNDPVLLNSSSYPRSTGWHKFSIKIGSTKTWWYVDGKRGKKKIGISPTMLDFIRVGSWSGSPDNQPSYYDDVCAKVMTESDPTLQLTDIAAYEGTAITPTDQKGLDADTPDTVLFKITSGTLPAGLVASATSVEAGSGPLSGATAVITISGTPAPGTAAGSPYTIGFEATDDCGHKATGSMTITVGLPCSTPPQDFDGDHDVDLGDFGTFSACFNGPNNPWPGPPIPQKDCMCADADKDGDVDIADFSAFSVCFNGPNRAAACP